MPNTTHTCTTHSMLGCCHASTAMCYWGLAGVVVVSCLSLLNANAAQAATGAKPAARIALAESPVCRHGVVRLGDVAAITASDDASSQRLARIPLFPAPSEGRVRRVSRQEIQEVLELRSVDPSTVQLIGVDEVAVRFEPGVDAPSRKKKSSDAHSKDVNEAIRMAMVHYLQQQEASPADWQVDFRLPASEISDFKAGELIRVLEGPQTPFVGRQAFRLIIPTSAGPQTMEVVADVRCVAQAVAVARAVRRGEVLAATDLQRIRIPVSGKAIPLAYEFEEVVGRQTDRSYAAGQPIDVSQLRAPVLVHRGEMVTVYARAAGVQIRTTARAMADGGQGDLLDVQGLSGKERFSARVIGFQELEVTTSDAPTRPAFEPHDASELAARKGNALRIAAPRAAKRSRVAATRKP